MQHPSAEYMDLPFEKAIDFFREKVALPTRRWDDLQRGMHSRAFVVAGVTRTELLGDLRGAVDKAISKGTTLAEFRKDFDAIVARHGWNYKGMRGWRTAVIYDTNLSTAYAAGHYARMTEPAVLAVRPYWKYLPSSSQHKRPEHVQWYGIVLRHDDPWWQTHYPPNGWGCKCGVMSMSNREFERSKGRLRTEAPEEGTYDYANKRTGEVSQVPVGIDPGWDYNPGQAAWGQRLSDQAMAEFKTMKADAWESMTPWTWQDFGLPEKLQPVAPIAKIGPRLSDQAASAAAVAETIGAPEQVFSLEANGFRYDLLVNAETLGRYIDIESTPYLPFIPEVLNDPQEVWLRFERHKGTGKIVLRQRIIKAIDMQPDGVVLVAEAKNGWLESWTVLSDQQLLDSDEIRSGKLVYRRD